MNNINEINEIIDEFNNNNFLKVISLSKNFVRSSPNYLLVNILLAKSFFKIKQIQQSLDILSHLTKLYPSDYRPLFELGNILRDLKNYRQSLRLYKMSLKLDSSNPSILNNIGTVYQYLDKTYLAIKYYSKAVDLEPKNSLFLFNLATTYRELNITNLALKLLNKAIIYDFENFEIHRNISLIIKYDSINHPHFKQLKKLELLKNDNTPQIYLLYFAIAKAYEDLGDIKNTVKYLRLANNSKNKSINYEITIIKKQFENVKKVFLKIKNNNFKKIKNKKSIFILGLPRSGTTLIEQILSAHHKVSAGGEIVYFSKHFNHFLGVSKKLDVDQITNNIHDETFFEIGKGYFEDLKTVSTDKIVTDKLPHNFILTGFINLACPSSKIIHCKRDINSIRFSMFKNFFPKEGLNFTYNEKNLKLYTELYLDLMKFWSEQSLKNYYEINYENLVDNFEEEVRKLLNFCELEWDPNCLNYYKNKNKVSTVSTLQVRKKIYKSSKSSWQIYKDYFTDLFD